MSNKKLLSIKCLVLAMDIIVILFVNILIYITTKKICDYYIARDFIETIDAIPSKPSSIMLMSILLISLLVISFVIRDFMYPNNNKIIFSTIIIDFVISIMIIYNLNFNYNGILLWVFVSVVGYTKGIRERFMLMFLAIISFLVTDYELLVINYKLFSIIDYIGYYDSNTQQYLLGIYNVLVSINIIIFIIYCIYVIQEQRGTIDEVSTLYKKLSVANDELQKANVQLQEYANMKEKMGETKERNRLAREIHDTLGHTLTGISAGIDACITTVEKYPESTKKRLEVISNVTRQGILDIRRSVNKLRPDALNRLSLDCAIAKMIVDINSGTSTQVFFECNLSNLKFDEDEENTIYRVIQESLTNAIRHGKATKIWVNIQKENGEIIFTIKDNGVGCKDIKNGFGTKHIIERIEMLNGTVVFNGLDGFIVNARIPIRWGINMIKVLIADDQELIRQSLQIVLSNRENIKVTDVVANGTDVIKSIRKVQPDVILMDIRMPKMDGVQCTNIVKENYPHIKVIILTTFDDDEYVYNALKFGASGYLLKGVSMDELVSAITIVYSGKAMINPDIATKVLKLFSKMAKSDYTIQINNRGTEDLTKTEWKIIAQVQIGLSNKEIAEILNFSEGTVRNYLSTILNKLDLRDRTQLAIWAVQSGVSKKQME